jgi:hypothetical protein
MHDLNTIAANLVLTFEGEALAARKRAESIRRETTPADNYPEYNRIHIEAPIKEALAEAEFSDRRAASARAGRLLVDPADVRWQMQNQGLIAQFAAAWRVDYVEPQMSPIIDTILS